MKKEGEKLKYISINDVPKQEEITDEEEFSFLCRVFKKFGGRFMESIDAESNSEGSSGVYGNVVDPIDAYLLSDSRVFLGMYFDGEMYTRCLLPEAIPNPLVPWHIAPYEEDVYFEKVSNFVARLSEVTDIAFLRYDFEDGHTEWCSPVLRYESEEHLIENMNQIKEAVHFVLREIFHELESAEDKTIKDLEEGMDDLGRTVFELLQRTPMLTEDDQGIANFMLHPVNLVLKNRKFPGRNVYSHLRLDADPIYEIAYKSMPYNLFHYRKGPEELRGQGAYFNGREIELAPDYNSGNMLDRLLLYRQMLLFGRNVEFKEHAKRSGMEEHELPDIFYPNEKDRLIILAEEARSFLFVFEIIDLLFDGEFRRIIDEKDDINPDYVRSKLNASEDQMLLIAELIDLAKIYYQSKSTPQTVNGVFIDAVKEYTEKKRAPGTYHMLLNFEPKFIKPIGDA
jgi:hypothetical protein